MAGPSRIAITGRYDHQPGNLQAGDAQFEIANSRLDLARIRNVQKLRPGISGTVELAGNGAGSVHAAAPRLILKHLNADISAKRIASKAKEFGDLSLTAHTTAGRLDFKLDSDLAAAKIHGSGTAQLTGQYSVSAKLNIDNVSWARIRELLGQENQPAVFDAALDGCEVAVDGPATNTAGLRGSLRVARLQVRNVPAPGTSVVTIENQGPNRGYAR